MHMALPSRMTVGLDTKPTVTGICCTISFKPIHWFLIAVLTRETVDAVRFDRSVIRTWFFLSSQFWTCFSFVERSCDAIPKEKLLLMDLLPAHQLVEGRVGIGIQQHQLEALLIHKADGVAAVHVAQALAPLTDHLQEPLFDLAAHAADGGPRQGVLLLLLLGWGRSGGGGLSGLRREVAPDISGSDSKKKYIVNTTHPERNCNVCKNTGKEPDQSINIDVPSVTPGKETGIDPTMAADLMKNLSSVLSLMTESSAVVSFGDTKGVIVKQDKEDISEVSIGYSSPNYTIKVADDISDLSTLQTSVFISKEAFVQSNTSDLFAGVFRFYNMEKDEMNSSVLFNEVIAIDMGTNITNLTNPISIYFRDVTEEAIASCCSWNGEGSLPNWTEDGCKTLVEGSSIVCRCSHLTFFAVIMSPLNTTISAADLKSLTYITYIGCGLSIFFLGIAFFMHFLMRRTKASMSKEILIQLMIALFLLNLSFLTNTWVANLDSIVGCTIMAALLHYSMLATFTWFAMNAFHLCLHFYRAGQMSINRYILKVSVTAWVTPSLVVITLLILNMYGKLSINTDGNEMNLCWITLDEIHYIINITYYAVVFLFTFTTFTLILSWLCLTKRSKVGYARMGSNSIDIVSVFGLCCTLGISWGFAFFAYGVMQLPSYYIFTILNSFQGMAT
ncbi:Adhesion G protein-coupled receptor G3 [Merluccius polli]|uniref:Adhesion G protein-coupled receptor G3 n=1 Tax=Merluccius polli TaxID=89951 RepID=A0AA47N519_MERPO|nr:Adhesion G protein-coupled receptor G3 [Merluccius polli]